VVESSIIACLAFIDHLSRRLQVVSFRSGSGANPLPLAQAPARDFRDVAAVFADVLLVLNLSRSARLK